MRTILVFFAIWLSASVIPTAFAEEPEESAPIITSCIQDSGDMDCTDS